MSNKKKEKEITFKRCRKAGRPDGLRMKTVLGYTFPDFVEAISSRWSRKLCYSIFRDQQSDMTFGELAIYSRSVASYLLSMGYQKGEKIAIFGESCPHWMVMYLGITYIGCIAVPILPDFTECEARNILAESGAKGVCLNQRAFGKVSAFITENNLSIFRMEDLVHIHEIPEGFNYLTAPGFPLTTQKIDDKAIASRKPDEDDVASIIFTSGTTGTSKGVVLSHKNILRNADFSTDEFVKVKPGYKVLSILPMSHVYEFTIGQILTLMCGCHITFLGKPPAVSVLMPAFKEIRPHVMLTVPLLIEKVYKAAVMPVLKDNPKIKRMMKTPLKGLVYRLIGHKLETTFGGRLVFFGIGGAPLDKEVEKFLHAAHFPYAIGYGLTETAPLIAGCCPTHSSQKPGYIGKVLNDDHVVLLSKNDEGVGEIAVKGVNVMSGYYNNPELNKEAFTADGYFKTGDLGAFDKKGRLAIMGRVKTMILGPGGENIYPESIESVINNMSFVQESLVVPENGGLLALIKIDLKAFAEKKMLDTKQAKDEAIKYIASLRKDINAQLSSFSRIDDVELQEEEFERTPSQKIKRFLYSSGDKRKKQSEKNSAPVQDVKTAEEKKAAEPKPAKPTKSEIAKEREELILKYKDSIIQEKKNWQIEKEKIRAERKLLDQRYQEAKTARKENLEKAKARFKKQKSKLKG